MFVDLIVSRFIRFLGFTFVAFMLLSVRFYIKTPAALGETWSCDVLHVPAALSLSLYLCLLYKSHIFSILDVFFLFKMHYVAASFIYSVRRYSCTVCNNMVCLIRDTREISR